MSYDEYWNYRLENSTRLFQEKIRSISKSNLSDGAKYCSQLTYYRGFDVLSKKNKILNASNISKNNTFDNCL